LDAFEPYIDRAINKNLKKYEVIKWHSPLAL
jgi:hypothetical protein